MPEPYLIAYVVNRALPIVNEADAQALTHINLAFGTLTNGLLDMRGLPDIGRIEDIRRWNPRLKFVLSVGGWGAGGFSNMAMTQKGRAAFAASVEAALDTYALDGVDIDWEYPCSDSAGIDADPRDRENFTALLEALRAVAGERIVSIAAGAGAYFVRDTQMDKVAAVCDYVQLMTYDMRSGFCSQAGHHTSLHPSAVPGDTVGASQTVALFANAGVPKAKIVIGAAFYSRMWGDVPDINHGLLQKAGTIGNYGPGYADLAARYIDKNGWTAYWDDAACAPYLFNGNAFISYDDPRSVALKCAYLKREGLRGIMYWEHGCDPTHTLLDAMRAALDA